MKYVVCFFLLIKFLFATSFVKEVWVLKDASSLNFQSIKKEQGFLKTNLPLKYDTKDAYWVKIVLHESKFLQGKDYVLKMQPLFSLNTVLFDKTQEKEKLDDNVLKLSKPLPKEIYTKIVPTKGLVYANLRVLELNEYVAANKKQFVFYGLAYGIIFTAFLYYLAFYVYNKQKVFLYYALTQASLLALLYSLDFVPTLANSFWFDVAILLFMLFLNLFTRDFLNTKKEAPFFDKVLLAVMVLLVLNTFLELFFEGFKSSFLLLTYVVSAVYVYVKTNSKPVLFYLMAWGIMILGFNLIELNFSSFTKHNSVVDLELLLHFIAPLESLVLAFALSYKMRLLEKQKRTTERLLIHQNKLSSMGEMLSNIAHQWRQPLTHLGYVFMNINTAFKHHKLDACYLKEKTQEATEQLEYMSDTIDDFRDFYLPQKQRAYFSVKEYVQKALVISAATLEKESISVEVQGDDFTLYGYESEFSQIILNLINNAKDAFVRNKTQEPKVLIRLCKNSVEVCDNAGGVNKAFKEKIFEPYFTSKEGGSGIGLYMSKVIIEKHFHGVIAHENHENGSCFYLKNLC